MSLAVSESSPQTQSVIHHPPAWTGKGLPDWFMSLQKDSWESYLAMPMPKRTDEAWRFADLRRLNLDSFVSAPPVSQTLTDSLVERSRLLETTGGKFVFINEQLAHAYAPKVDGLICMPITEAAEKHPQLLQEHFMTQEATLGSQKFALLHKSRTSSGLFLYVPSGTELALPIEVYHWAVGAQSSLFPHTLIVTGENAKVTVIDYFQSAAPSDASFSCGVVDLVAGRGSKIRYVAYQGLSETSSAIHISSTLASSDADVKSLQVQLGSSWSRTESVSHLNGKGANSDMLAVAIPSGHQEIDQRTLQHHAEPNTTSDLLYKNALYDQSRSIFAGLIMVDEGAHYTDAFQTCRNLLLSDEAEANSMPGLEINADQVKCSHGSTSGPITDESIFYFNARGITTENAKKLIAQGFAFEAIERLGDEGLQTMIEGLLAAKFAHLD